MPQEAELEVYRDTWLNIRKHCVIVLIVSELSFLHMFQQGLERHLQEDAAWGGNWVRSGAMTVDH